MIRVDSAQLDLWSSVLPAEVWRLPEELRRVDGLLAHPTTGARGVGYGFGAGGSPSAATRRAAGSGGRAARTGSLPAAGGTPWRASHPDRIVSLADPDARPVVKGKLGKPVQFGYKTQIIEAEGGFVTDYTVEQGNPRDSDALLPAVRRHKARFRRVLQIVATDRGYDTAVNQRGCRELGVRNVAIPKRGKISAERRQFQQRRSFRRAQAWRSGSEATISRLKRKYGLDTSRYRGYDRVATGVGLTILVHNLHRAARL